MVCANFETKLCVLYPLNLLQNKKFRNFRKLSRVWIKTTAEIFRKKN